MSTQTSFWYEDDEPRDLARWGIAAAIVVGTHAALVAGYLYWQHAHPHDIGADAPVVNIDFDPVENQPDATQPDVAPAPDDMVEQKPTPPEEKPAEQAKVEPPPDVSPAVAQPVETPPEKIEPKPPVPRTAARPKGGVPRVDTSWETGLVRHLQRFKRYPSEAQARAEEGMVVLGFSVDRTGHVLSRHIVQSSGHPDLDAEVMALVERAQPLPAFPASMTQAQLDLTVPIRFSLR